MDLARVGNAARSLEPSLLDEGAASVGSVLSFEASLEGGVVGGVRKRACL